MSIVVRAGRRYPWVVATLVVGALGGVLSALGEGRATTLLLGGYAVLVAARAAWSMVRELREGTFGVDVLAVTAIGASVAVGELWAALVIVLMLTGGEALEDYAALRARADLSALLERAPQVAHRTLVDGTLEDVHVDEVAEGDQIVVRPGEVVPVDGTLESAAGELDESSLTGESLPVERVAGDVVLSGASTVPSRSRCGSCAPRGRASTSRSSRSSPRPRRAAPPWCASPTGTRSRSRLSP